MGSLIRSSTADSIPHGCRGRVRRREGPIHGAMGIQAALIAIGRAGLPAVAGVMHDRLGGYRTTIALVTTLLAISALLVGATGRGPIAAPDEGLR
jgi:hypothetical protein